MNDRYETLWMALTIAMVVVGVFFYYDRVVKPSDEIRWEIIACMDAAGDLHSEEVYVACHETVVSRR